MVTSVGLLEDLQGASNSATSANVSNIGAFGELFQQAIQAFALIRQTGATHGSTDSNGPSVDQVLINLQKNASNGNSNALQNSRQQLSRLIDNGALSSNPTVNQILQQIQQARMSHDIIEVGQGFQSLMQYLKNNPLTNQTLTSVSLPNSDTLKRQQLFQEIQQPPRGRSYPSLPANMKQNINFQA